jgi:hypothetical protein
MEALKTNAQHDRNELIERMNNLESKILSEIAAIKRDMAVTPSHITTNDIESIFLNCLERLGVAGALQQSQTLQNQIVEPVIQADSGTLQQSQTEPNHIVEPVIQTVDTVNHWGMFRRPIPSHYKFPVRESPRQMWFLWHEGNNITL